MKTLTGRGPQNPDPRTPKPQGKAVDGAGLGEDQGKGPEDSGRSQGHDEGVDSEARHAQPVQGAQAPAEAHPQDDGQAHGALRLEQAGHDDAGEGHDRPHGQVDAPVAITRVMPTATTMWTADWTRMFVRFSQLRKVGGKKGEDRYEPCEKHHKAQSLDPVYAADHPCHAPCCGYGWRFAEPRDCRAEADLRARTLGEGYRYVKLDIPMGFAWIPRKNRFGFPCGQPFSGSSNEFHLNDGISASPDLEMFIKARRERSPQSSWRSLPTFRRRNVMSG